MIQRLLFILLPLLSFSQGYTSYFTGNPTNITTTPEFGICMMGGASEHDNAMKWLLQKANGGDVVVLRSSGSNGYNNYLYSELGIPVNSVETLVITSVAGATNPYVLERVAKAEMIWFAGGDQWNYVSYFKNNALEDILNDHINVKHAPIGGTSAGMAILGSKYFSAQNGSVTSAQAMANPYVSNVTIGNNDFLSVPFLNNIITDTHYDNPDRRGRQATFLARSKVDFGTTTYGIACNEYVAVCIGTDGIGHVYGDYPNYQEFAYFIQPNCNPANVVENCQSGQPLTWNYGGEALKVYKIPGTMTGTHTFDLNVWENGIGSGGSWENWSVLNGTLSTSPGVAPVCNLNTNEVSVSNFQVSPNPFSDFVSVDAAAGAKVEIFDSLGKSLFYNENFSANKIDTSAFAHGLYVVKVTMGNQTSSQKIVK